MKDQGGFTLIEIIIAILLLTSAVLGIAASAGRMIAPAADAEMEFAALLAVEDRITQVRLDPRYAVLDSLYAGTEQGLPGLDGYSRVTDVTTVSTPIGGGKYMEYLKITVTMSGPTLKEPISRMVIMAAP